eukprot:6565079-Heterocapsa_arctica.AAC.1
MAKKRPAASPIISQRPAAADAKGARKRTPFTRRTGVHVLKRMKRPAASAQIAKRPASAAA